MNKKFNKPFSFKLKMDVNGDTGIVKNVGEIHHQRAATFITARMGSSRLPGKHLLQIMEKPVIEHLIERVRPAKLPQQVILCTTILPKDDVLEQIAMRAKILTFRGHPTDILMRWLKAAEFYHVDFIVSADGDDVFCDPRVKKKLEEDHKQLYGGG